MRLNMKSSHKKILLSLMVIFVYVVLTIQVAHSATQLTFNLDVDNPIFRYTDNALNTTNTTENIIFSGNQNITRYIRLPKNSTILDSSINFTGLITPAQTYGTGSIGYYSVAVGNVTGGVKNDIAIGTGNRLMIVLNSSFSQVWNFSTTSGITYSVAIGNVTSDANSEIAIGSQDTYVYLLNSTGNQVWSYKTSGQVWDVAIGDITSDSGNEIAVGSDKVYVLNSTGSLKWTYATSGTTYSVAIGDVNDDGLNEVAAGDGSRVYVLNYTGNQTWNFTTSDIVYGLAIGKITSDSGKDVIVGSNQTVYVLNSTGYSKKTYYIGDTIWGVDVGDVTSDSGNEVAVASNDNKVYVLNSTLDFVWSYTTGNSVQGVAIGDITTDSLNETAAVSLDVNLYVLNFNYYPTNLSVDVGNDGDYDWSHSEIKLRYSTTMDNTTLGQALQDYLNSCTSKICNVSLVLHSSASGELKISNINITYDYNASDSVSYASLDNTWSRTNNTLVNETIGYATKRVSYYSNPANSIELKYVKINSTATACDFAGSHYTSITVNGQNACNITNITISYRGNLRPPDMLWDNNMTSSIPIYSNETSPYAASGESAINVTIWNATTVIFFNVTANVTLNDSNVIANAKIYVQWYGNGTLYDITPTSSSTTCDSNSPTYTSKQVGSDIFWVCKQDRNSNTRIDFFKWKQANTNNTGIIYKINGSSNNEPVFGTPSINRSSDIWGSGFNYSVSVSDVDGDTIEINFWLKGNSLSWERKGSVNVTSTGTAWFNYTSNKSWTGSNQYLFEYRDFNTSNFVFHNWQNTSEYTGPTVDKHNVSIIYVQGNDTQVNRTGSNSTLFVTVVNDTDLNQNVSNVNCSFWVTSNGVNFILANSTITNSTGHCNFTFDPNASYTARQQWWKGGVYQDSYYKNRNSTNFTVSTYGLLNINLTGLITTQNTTRSGNVSIEARLYDENYNYVNESGLTCTWYLNNETMDIIETATSTTNSSGACNHLWMTNCTHRIGVYPLNVSLSGTLSYYTIVNSISNINNTLKSNLNLTLTNPVNSSIYHRADTVILNSTILDNCNQVPTKYYNVSWYGNSMSNCGSNPVLNEENGTWALPALCYPRAQIIIANATGDFYNSAKKNVTFFIYGWAQVQVLDPSSDKLINRTSIGEYYDIICSVEDTNVTGATQGYSYPVNYWYGSTYIGKNFTKSTGNASYTWNISSTLLPENFYTVKCNITDNSTLFYNVSRLEYSSTNIRIAGSSDTSAPVINSVNATSAQQYSNVTINVNVSDLYGVDKVWVNITLPNTTIFSQILVNTSIYNTNGIWNASLNFTEIGDYDLVVFANDTSGNVTNATSWFEVYNSILFYGSTTDSTNNNVSLDLTFYRNSTNSIIHHFLTNTSIAEYNFTVHKRFFDLGVKVFNHSIRFYNINATSVNIMNPLNFTNIPLNLVDYPVANRGHEYAAIEAHTNFTFDNATLTMNYSGYSVDYENANSVTIYRCGNWTYPTCNSVWAEVTGRVVNTTAHTVSANITNTSAYYSFEKEICGNSLCGSGESCSICPGDCGQCGSENTGGTSGGTGGGGGGGGGTKIESTCGNNVCETGENSENCPKDCSYPESLLSLRTNLTNIQLDPGEQRVYALWIKNNADYDINPTISAVGIIKDFVALEKSIVKIGPVSEEIVGMYISIPSGTEPGTYTGEIAVTVEGRTKSLPVTITVSLAGASYLDIVVQAMDKLVGMNDTANFHITLYNLGFKKKLDIELTYLIKEFETDRVVYKDTEQKLIETSQSFVKKVSLSKLNITAGKYSFEVRAKYDDKIASTTDEFEVITSFWTSQRIRQIFIIAISVSSIITIIVVRKRYKEWKLSKARYIFPLNYNKLPKGPLWIGKIAETDKKATFTMDDLRTHLIAAGATGSGKSVSAMIFVEELLQQKIPIVVFDPTAQWTGFVRPCKDANLMKYYPEFGMNPTDARPYNGMIYEVTDPKVKIDFKRYMNPGEITVFTLNKLKPGEYDVAVSNIIDTIFAQGWEESTKLRMIVVFDEVHRLLEKYGGTGGYVYLEKACREFRKWGIGLVMISQVLSDFKEAIKGNVLTEIQLHTKSLGDLNRVEKKYGLDYAKRVTRLEVGVGMIQNPKYNDGRPWFIAFRPTLHDPHKITDAEMETYKQYAAILADVEEKIEKIEKSGKDVFDLKTELRLAKDKLKKGRFRMAKIYIDSLTKHLSGG